MLNYLLAIIHPDLSKMDMAYTCFLGKLSITPLFIPMSIGLFQVCTHTNLRISLMDL